MSKTLVIVESPAKAKSIQKYLGQDYLIKATMGHMFDLPKDELGVDFEQGFKPTYVLSKDRKDNLRTILDAAAEAEQILIASDPDREGEAIAWHVAKALEKTKKPIARIEFHEVTKPKVQAAVKNPRPIDEKLFHAQEARRVLDRLAGYLVSPYVIRHFGKNLSAGRVQSVVVRLIVDREKEILNFKPEEYWTLTAHLAKEKSDFLAKYIDKITSKDQADAVKKDLLASEFEIVSVERDTKEKKAPPPLITVKMQGQASTKLKFNASKTMELAQKLFEAGYITYHRVDSYRIDDVALHTLRDYLKEQNLPIPKTPNFFKDSENAQQAHECIRPTDVYRTSKDIMGSEAEKKLYNLIRDRYIACQMAPAVYDTVVVKIRSSQGKHMLKALGRIQTAKGWQEILEDEEKSNDVKLPIINQGEIWQLGPKKIAAEQKFTKPPPRYSERSLVDELEARNIGRPSTYAAITSKVRDRNYVKEEKTIFYPTELGTKVTEDLVQYFDFLKYDYTAEVEQKLDRIAAGKFDYLAMMQEFYPLLVKQLKSAAFSKKIDYGYKCAKCQAMMDLRQGKFGNFLSCVNYPECKFTMECTMEDGKPILTTRAVKLEDGVQCQRCGSGMVRKDSKFGPFYGCSTWPKCTAIQYIPYKDCSKCGKDMTIKIFDGEAKLSCTNISCRLTQPIPKNMKVDWTSFEKINQGKLHKKTEKEISRGDKFNSW